MTFVRSLLRWHIALNRRNAWLVMASLAWLAACGTDLVPISEDTFAANGDSLADFSIGDVPSDATAALDPLVGTWTFSGYVPAIVTITLTLKADKTFTLAETVAPLTTPVGYVANGCVTTHSLFGTYAEVISGSTNTLKWTFAGGTANAISGCDNMANNASGMPMTPADIAAYTAQGLLLPATETYSVTATTLVLTESAGGSKTFTK